MFRLILISFFVSAASQISAQSHWIFYFKPGSTTLVDSSSSQLNSFISGLKSNASYYVEGYADSTGTLGSNRNLSIDRANYIGTLIQKKGIDIDKINLSFWG